MADSIEAYKLCEVQITDKELGRGSFATVFELNIKGLKCAGKKIHELHLPIKDEDDKNANERFERECQLLSQVRHPNIVQFLGVYFPENATPPFLVMEFLPMNLTFCIKEYYKLSEEISYSILYDVALGLNYLHSQIKPIVHRDLSSNNVLLTPNLTAKISDLGVAKILNLTPQQATRMTRNPGTLAYMPPEVMIGHPKYNTSVDVFSYGITMVHLFSGKWPEPQVGQIIINDDGQMIPVSEAKRREEFLKIIGDHHPLMELIQRCLNNNPKQRACTSDIVWQLEELVSERPFGTKFTNRLDILRQLEADKKEVKKEKLEEEEIAKEIEVMKKEIQESNDILKLASTTKMKELQQELESLTNQNKELSANRLKHAAKVRDQDELLTNTIKSLEHIQQDIRGRHAQELGGGKRKVRTEPGDKSSKHKRPMTSTGIRGEQIHKDAQKRRSVDLSISLEEHSKSTDELGLRDGNSDSVERTGTFRRMSRKLGQVIERLGPKQQVIL